MPNCSYVAGFLFSPKLTRVALIKKTKPTWMNGLYNAIGGKIEENESPDDAMKREFLEETGVLITSWQYYCTLNNQTSDGSVNTIYFYTAKSSKIEEVVTNEANGEEVKAINLYTLIFEQLPAMANLIWLCEMAKSVHVGKDRCKMFYVQEQFS